MSHLKHHLFSAVATALVCGAPAMASAADLGGPQRRGASKFAPAEPDQRPAVWQGLYAGFTIGAVGAGVDVDKFGKKDDTDLDGSSAGFGGVVGYNIANGPWVWGVEADINGGGLDEKKAIAGLGTLSAESNWYGSLRLRGGYAWERVMIYGTAGIAFSELDIKSSLGGKDSGVMTGLAAGFGGEYAIDNNWQLRAETLFYAFDTDDVKLAGANRDVSLGFATVRLGATRKF